MKPTLLLLPAIFGGGDCNELGQKDGQGHPACTRCSGKLRYTTQIRFWAAHQSTVLTYANCSGTVRYKKSLNTVDLIINPKK